MNELLCPLDSALFAVATGEPDDSIRQHVIGCPHCQRRLQSLQNAVNELREIVRDSPGAPIEL